MGSGASAAILQPPYESEEAALDAGKSPKEIEEWKKEYEKQRMKCVITIQARARGNIVRAADSKSPKSTKKAQGPEPFVVVDPEDYFVKTIFDTLDLNSDSLLQMAEVDDLLEKMGVEREEKRKECIRLIDPNGDGVVTFKEFRDWTRGREADLCVVVGGYV
jgi:hypothetical protein